MKETQARSPLDSHPADGETASSLAWIKLFATMSSLIAIGGLIALFVHHAHAEDNGFTPGGRPFNPYAPPPSGGAASPPPFFDEDEEDDFDEEPFSGNYTPPSGVAGGDSGPGSSGDSTDRSSPPSGGVQIGGQGSGVTEGARSAAQPAAAVDDDGAEGSKEVITDFNFPDADIMDIAKALGKLTGKNFILDKDVKGRITVISNSPITVRDAWRAFLTALDVNNFALIPSGKFVRIARSRDARDKQLKTYTGKFSPDSDALITRVFSLKYLSSEEVARNFRSFMPANSRIIPYEQTNTVIVTDTGSNIAKLSKLLEILDVEGYDAGIEVIPVKYAAAAELAKLIDTLIPGTGPTTPGNAPRFGGSSRMGQFSARKTKEGGVINTIIADERTNNLIVHANAKGAGEVRMLVKKLDRKLPASVGGGKVHVVYLQFSDAEQLANTLNTLTSGGAQPSRPGAGGVGTGSNPVQSTLFEGAIKVAADKSTNSLVITASPQDFVTLQRVVNRLDVPRDQVFAESVIMEVGLGKNFSFSANFFSVSSGIGSMPNGDLQSFIRDPLASTGAILGFKSGSKKIKVAGGQEIEVGSVQGLIRALQANDIINIVATPQILTLDNTEAAFESAEKVPVATQTIANNGVTTAGLRDQSVAISMKLKPSINKLSNFVKLEIDTKLEDFSNRQLSDAVQQQGGVSTFSRNVKTAVVVADGDTVVLGGLTRDTTRDGTRKVPLLGDIPVLGWLFKSKSSESQKSNLLIFITPKIVRQYEGVRAILDRKLKERDNFLEKSAGGVDPGRAQRDSVIRSLPNLKTLLNEKPATNFSIEKGDESASMGSFGSPEAGEAGGHEEQPNPFDGPGLESDASSMNYAPSDMPPPPPPIYPDDQG